MKLEKARLEINEIDNEILKLFKRRMDASCEIARIKISEGKEIYSADREKSILEKVKILVPETYSQYAVSLYTEIMALSRSFQHEIFALEKHDLSGFQKIIKDSREELKTPKVAVQGVPGAYSSIAAGKMYPHGSLLYNKKWEDVLTAVENGTADYGVLPIENSSAGTVPDVYDLLLKHNCSIVKAYQLKVEHCLLGVPGAAISQVRDVYSHPHAFPQCPSFFEDHKNLNKVTCPNTAMAAEMIAKLGDRTKAAISSKECAEIYSLDILAESIQQAGDNRTRFISVSKKHEFHDGASKISIVISLPHVTGSLYRALSQFSLNGHNLTQIISRPNKDKPFEYFFYIDFSGNINNEKTATLLETLKEELPFFCFLGNYEEN